MARKNRIKEITKKTTDPEEKEFQAEGIEGTKEAEPEEKEKEEKKKEKTKNYVTCEDVLKNLREKGYKI